MQDDRNVGYLILEAASERDIPTKVRDISRDEVVIETVLQEAQVPNRNKRLYTKEAIESGIKNPMFQEKLKKIKYCLIQAEFANRNTNTFIKESQTKPMNINPLQGEWSWAMQEAAAAVQGKEIVVGK